MFRLSLITFSILSVTCLPVHRFRHPYTAYTCIYSFVGAGQAVGCSLVALSDYTAVGASEVSLREGQQAELLKVGCAGWWYVRLAGTYYKRRESIVLTGSCAE